MRKLSELYKTVLVAIETTRSVGICMAISKLGYNDINNEEYEVLLNDLKSNKPKPYNQWYNHYDKFSLVGGYWWDKFSKEPRIKYLKARIADLEGRGE